MRIGLPVFIAMLVLVTGLGRPSQATRANATKAAPAVAPQPPPRLHFVLHSVSAGDRICVRDAHCVELAPKLP
jgi:hypothetical protein